MTTAVRAQSQGKANWTGWVTGPRLRLPAIMAAALMSVMALNAGPAVAGQDGAAAEGPQATVAKLNAVLLETMKEAETLGFDGRYEKLEPVLKDVFNFRLMAATTLGSANWRELDEAQQDRWEELYTGMSVSTYANRFKGYSGQDFAIDARQDLPGERIYVKTTLVNPEGNDVKLDYVLKEFSAGWKIVDVYFESNSQIALNRSEYSKTFETEGYDGLTGKIEEVIVKMEAAAESSAS